MSFEIILDQVIKTSPFLIDPESKKTSVQRFQSSAAPSSSEILHDEISFFTTPLFTSQPQIFKTVYWKYI